MRITSVCKCETSVKIESLAHKATHTHRSQSPEGRERRRLCHSPRARAKVERDHGFTVERAVYSMLLQL